MALTILPNLHHVLRLYLQLGGEDFLRELTEFMLNRIMEADVTQRINAEPPERSDERETYRNG
ncbi:transposase, partial [Candidatus Erwinia dacicola]|uniref:transposase n=1 Tax=Candidatus Erwinia dacicola TaxID=252393 RepID=UPI00164A8D70